MSDALTKTSIPEFLMGGGEMGRLIREFDWSSTPLGRPDKWPQSLKTCVRILLTSPQPMFVWWGQEALINIYNDAYSHILGQKHPKALGRSGKETWAEIWDEVGKRADIVFNKNEGTYDDALRLVMNRFGYDEETWFKFSYTPIPGERGGTAGLFCVCTEETQTIKAQQQLAENNQKIQNIFRQAQVAIVVYEGPNFIVQTANEIALEIWGKTEQDVLGKPFFEISPELKISQEPLLTNILQTGKPFVGKEYPVSYYKAGVLQSIYYDFVYTPLRNDTGKIVGIISIGSDVTHSVNARRKIESSENHLRTIIQTAPGPIGIFMGEDLRISVANKPMFAFWQVAEEDALGRSLFHLKPELREQGYFDMLLHVFQNGETINGEEVPASFIRRDGSTDYYYFNFTLQPFKEPNGETGGVLVTGTDVTGLVLARKKIEESEAHFRALVNATSDVIYRMNADWSEMRELQGRGFLSDTKEPTTDWAQKYIPPKDRSLVEKAIATAIKAKTVFELEHQILQADGTLGWTFSRAIPVLDNNGNILEWLGAASDITKRKLAEEKIRQSESRFRILAETLPQMIWVTDEKGNNEFYSQRWQEYSGFADPFDAWAYMIHPDDKERSTQAYQNAYSNGVPFRYDVRLKNKAGDYRWHSSIAEPVKDEHGKIVKWVGSLSDIHDQKNLTEKLESLVAGRTRELAEVNQNLQRSNEDLQQFAHVASHDLKEPVRKIMTFSSRLKIELGNIANTKAITYLSKIERAANRMYSMIDGVLHYASLDALELTTERVDLNQLMESIVSDLEVPIQQKGAEIHCENLPVVEGSSILLYQLFYNLVGNSLKFSKPGIPPVIKIMGHIDMARDPGIEGSEKQAQYKIVISDNGIGFDAKDAEKIFSTFTRLHAKDHYEGTGLGLSLCRKIVEQHGGNIQAKGKEGEGATFIIVLPVKG